MDCPQYRCTSREFPQKQSLGGGEEGRRGGGGRAVHVEREFNSIIGLHDNKISSFH